MSASCTPGPWHCDGDAGYGELNGYRIRASEAPEYIIAVAIGDVPELAVAAEANARLIAAAPDLVEALQIIMSEWEARLDPDADTPGWPDDASAVMNDAWKRGFYEKARTALSKALGEGEGM